MTALRCEGCARFGSPGRAHGVYYLICDCGTVTTVPDFSDKFRAVHLLIKKGKWG